MFLSCVKYHFYQCWGILEKKKKNLDLFLSKTVFPFSFVCPIDSAVDASLNLIYYL